VIWTIRHTSGAGNAIVGDLQSHSF
jgi:hypothetical protein